MSSAPAFADDEFGACGNEQYRYTSRQPEDTVFEPGHEQEAPLFILLQTYVSYVLVICVGHLRDFFGKRLRPQNYRHLMPNNGYAALNSDFDSFYTRRLKARIDDCFSYPTTGVPGRTVNLLERQTLDYNATYQPTGRKLKALNISSYNYLGFAQARGGCADAVELGIRRYGITSGASRLEGGSLDLHLQAEALIARFVGQEDSLVVSMGFATNSTTIPALVSKGCLVISDSYNHSSIRFGIRLSGASIRVFQHNDMADLESVLRESISQGQPKNHRPWKKILVIVEGLYSMEGTMVDLPRIIELKKKYKFYLFVDEAHSIGALGPRGRGVCDYFGIPPRNIDILMGTFTKSFGASGGYIAGSRALISRLRLRSHAGSYAESMTPPVLTQIIASMASIMGVEGHAPSLTNGRSLAHTPGSGLTEHSPHFEHLGPAPVHMIPKWIDLPPALRDGSEGGTRLNRLCFNSRYLHRGLRKLGFIVYGHHNSPIVPLLLFNIGKMAPFSRMMLARKVPVAIVIVAYPATSLTTARVRFCVSAAHTKGDMDELLRACDEIGDVLNLKYNDGERWSIDQVIDRAIELVHMP
ncbi:serine palmitoyltransferase 2 [Auricularia subglabra TFB-10046 SS5]|nr:serine palmitoyltransferase 2 [Auricularia subglabra TFB-10046 SS5]